MEYLFEMRSLAQKKYINYSKLYNAVSHEQSQKIFKMTVSKDSLQSVI